MAVRLRLRRMGRKKRPYYRIVAIDSRAKRDGKYLESIGTYYPIPDPFELRIDTERALFWLKRGAQPSDTVRSLLRRQGIMLRWDLLKRGKSEAEIEEELKKWEILQQEKIKRIEAARIQEQRAKQGKAVAEEPAKEEKAQAVAEKAPEKEEAQAAVEEAPKEEAPKEEKAAAEDAAKDAEVPVEEAKKDAEAQEPAEAATEVVKEETSKAEAAESAADESKNEEETKDQE